MVFNDTTNFQGIIQDIDFLLFGDGTLFNSVYPMADRTRSVNLAWDEAVAEFFKADPNYNWDDTTNTDFPCATTTLVAGLDHYPIIDSALKVHRVRAMDENGVMQTLTPVLRSELSDDELIATGTPTKFYKLGEAIFPCPIPTYSAAAGLELEFQRGANYFTASDTTKQPGFSSQFHEFLPIGAALRYAIANDMPKKAAQLRAEKENIRKSIGQHYQKRSPDEKPKLKLARKSQRSFGL